MNQELQNRVNRVIREIEKRSQAEKLLVLAVLLVGVVMGYLTYVSDPKAAAREIAQGDIASVTRQIQAQQASYNEKVLQSQEDPNRFANERIAAIRTEQDQLDEQISSLARELVTPNNMTRILIAALQGQTELELIQIQNTGAEPLRIGVSGQVRSAGTDDNESSLSRVMRNISGQVYQHGITLQFRGDYFNTLRYLLLLEQLSDGFYWDSLTYTLGQWPTATISLQLHTLSTEEGFLGV